MKIIYNLDGCFENIFAFFLLHFTFRCRSWPRNISNILRFVFSSVCSTKHLKGASKENSSPFFLETDGKNPVSRYIYNLLTDGIKGNAKKDTLLAILHEIAVRRQLDNNLCRSKYKFWFFPLSTAHARRFAVADTRHNWNRRCRNVKRTQR